MFLYGIHRPTIRVDDALELIGSEADPAAARPLTIARQFDILLYPFGHPIERQT